MDEKTGMPLKQDIFLEAGVHIGTKIRTSDMREFIFKRRDDGLYILDLRQSAERLMAAAKLISKYDPQDVTVVASRIYSGNPAKKFAKLTGINIIRGRFTPGTMTNMTCKGFTEPKLILVCDPKGEREALMESAQNGVTVIAFCDSNNETKYVDYIVPINNKGKRSLALAFYVLAREMMMSQGKIKSYDEFTYDIQYFEELLEEDKVEEDISEPEEETKKEEKAKEKKTGEKSKEEIEPKKEAVKEHEKKPVKSEKKEKVEEKSQKEEPEDEKSAEKAKEEKPKRAEKEETKKKD
ncbi:30S ribosomal protein S2 [Candidatus Micrarchaeota archaeon]|nr:30S ribosomal protein S2 [Candidatus Micrarchaeota archaeon]